MSERSEIHEQTMKVIALTKKMVDDPASVTEQQLRMHMRFINDIEADIIEVVKLRCDMLHALYELRELLRTRFGQMV